VKAAFRPKQALSNFEIGANSEGLAVRALRGEEPGSGYLFLVFDARN